MESKDGLEQYKALSSVLSTNRDRVLEIEVLPSSIAPQEPQLLLIEGNCIGVPKKLLVKAFLVAIKIFRKPSASVEAKKDILDSTGVILLFDPEYLTAANYRKRRLLNIAKHSPDELAANVSEELIFLDSILTSPLHRQSKSPTLWFHRWWLLTNFLISSLRGFASAIRPDEELQIVLKSGERHPNNYYAFQHARKIIARLSISDASERQHSLSSTKDVLLQWCLQHPSDVSGWSMMLFLLTFQSPEPEETALVLQPVLTFVKTTHWRRQALQMFLRSLLASPTLLLEADRIAVQELCQ